MKKILLTLGSLTATAIPIGVVVACGGPTYLEPNKVEGPINSETSVVKYDDTIYLPETILIESNTFKGVPIKRLSIPKAFEIQDGAFQNIVNAYETQVTMLSKFESDAEKNRIFGNNNWNLIDFIYVDDIKNLNRDENGDNYDTKRLSFPTLLEVEDMQLTKFWNLESLNIMNATRVGDFAAPNSLITSLDLPEAISIGRFAFQASALNFLNIPKATEIGNNAFRLIKNLSSTHVIMSSALNLTAKKNEIFGAGNWDKINFTWVNEDGKEPNLHNTSNLLETNPSENLESKSICFPKLTEIYDIQFNTFHQLSQIDSLDLPELTSVWKSVFSGASLKFLNIPKLSNIGDSAFKSIQNSISTHVIMQSQFNSDSEKNRIFGEGNWDNIKFTWISLFDASKALSKLTAEFSFDSIKFSSDAPEGTAFQYSYDEGKTWGQQTNLLNNDDKVYVKLVSTNSYPILEENNEKIFVVSGIINSVKNIFTSTSDKTAKEIEREFHLIDSAVNDSQFVDQKKLTSISMLTVNTIGSNAFKNAPLETLNIPVVNNIGDNAFAGILNSSSTHVSMQVKFSSTAERTRIFGEDNWNNIDFTWLDSDGNVVEITEIDCESILDNLDPYCTIDLMEFGEPPANVTFQYDVADYWNNLQNNWVDWKPRDIPSGRKVNVRLVPTSDTYVLMGNNERVFYFSNLHNTFTGKIIGSTHFGLSAEMKKDKFDHITKNVGASEFTKEPELEYVTLPYVENIGDNAFYDSPINELKAPLLKTIGDNAFYKANISRLNLLSIYSVGENAFRSSKLTWLWMSGWVESIGDNAFASIVNESTTPVQMPKWFDNPYDKDRIFGKDNWDKLRILEAQVYDVKPYIRAQYISEANAEQSLINKMVQTRATVVKENAVQSTPAAFDDAAEIKYGFKYERKPGYSYNYTATENKITIIVSRNGEDSTNHIGIPFTLNKFEGYFDTTLPYDVTNWDNYRTAEQLEQMFMAITDEVSAGMFFKQTHLTSVSLPHVKTIGTDAFLNSPLTSLFIPEVTSIGDRAFKSSLLQELNITNAHTIGQEAFVSSPLHELDIKSARDIGLDAFKSVIWKIDTTNIYLDDKYRNKAMNEKIFGLYDWIDMFIYNSIGRKL